MDIFRFTNPLVTTKMEHGKLLNGIRRKLWIEKYQSAGEFAFEGSVDDGLKEQLPIGSFVSHVGTKEIMVVENHEISQDSGGKAKIVVTGRGFETFLDNRIVGWSGYFPEEVSANGDSYSLIVGELWDHVIQLVEDHMIPGQVTDPNNAIPYLEIGTDLSGVIDPRARTVKRGSLYSRTIELLKIDDLGIRVIRPNALNENVTLFVHGGVDRSNTVIFSYDGGEIESADYLWSIRSLKNAALLTGKWIQTVYSSSEVESDRRMMEIDATSVDEGYGSVPTGQDLTDVVNAMEQLAIDTLSSQKSVTLVKVELSKKEQNAKYREDYNIGDIVTVIGDYNATAKMRVEEHVEIEDETGSRGYPTLRAIEEEI